MPRGMGATTADIVQLVLANMYGIESHDPRISFSDLQQKLQSKPVEIVVGEGEEAQTFWVHRSFVCDRSDFFRGALEGGWRESIEQKIHLPEDDPKIFALYLHLIYYDTLPTRGYPEEEDSRENPKSQQKNVRPPFGDDGLPPKTLVNVDPEYDALTHLYVFCEKILDIQAQKLVLDAIIGRSMERIDPSNPFSIVFSDEDHIATIYDGTPEGDKARKVLVEMYADFAEVYWLTEGDWHPEFLSELSARLVEMGFDKLNLEDPTQPPLRRSQGDGI